MTVFPSVNSLVEIRLITTSLLSVSMQRQRRPHVHRNHSQPDNCHSTPCLVFVLGERGERMNPEEEKKAEESMEWIVDTFGEYIDGFLSTTGESRTLKVIQSLVSQVVIWRESRLDKSDGQLKGE